MGKILVRTMGPERRSPGTKKSPSGVETPAGELTGRLNECGLERAAEP